jgi:hypothetical protein
MAIAPSVGVPVLVIGTTTNYKLIYQGNTSDTHSECPNLQYSIWAPQPGAGSFALGSYAVPGYGQPNTPVYTISAQNEDPSNPLLVAPSSFEFIWMDPVPNVVFGDCQPNYAVAIYAPIPPPNYVPLGMVATGCGFNSQPPQPDPKQFVCLRSDYAVPASIGQQIFSGSGFAGGNQNGSMYAASIWQVNGSLAMYAQPNQNSPSGKWFVPNNLPTKDPA